MTLAQTAQGENASTKRHFTARWCCYYSSRTWAREAIGDHYPVRSRVGRWRGRDGWVYERAAEILIPAPIAAGIPFFARPEALSHYEAEDIALPAYKWMNGQWQRYEGWNMRPTPGWYMHVSSRSFFFLLPRPERVPGMEYHYM